MLTTRSLYLSFNPKATGEPMHIYMHLLRQNLTTLTLSYLSFDRIILTNFSSGKILPHVFWLVLGNMNIFNPS